MSSHYPYRCNYDSLEEYELALDAYERAEDDRDDEYLEMKMEERNGRD